MLDLLFTLVAPTLYPGSRTRLGWIEDVTGIPEPTLRESCVTAEHDLAAGRSPNGPRRGTDSNRRGSPQHPDVPVRPERPAASLKSTETL